MRENEGRRKPLTLRARLMVRLGEKLAVHEGNIYRLSK
jgi:hypothetical protein